MTADDCATSDDAAVAAVSVVMPLYNKEAVVGRALASIKAQTFRDFEVIVVDDGSTDGSAAVVDETDDPRIRLVRQDNAGPAAARNRGLEEARSDLVAFLDGDDEWLPTFLERGVETLRAEPRAATVSSGYFFFPGGEATTEMWRRRGLREGLIALSPATPPGFAVHLLAYLHPCTTIARRDVVLRHGGFCRLGRYLYGEDAFLWLQVLLAEPAAVLLEPLVRIHGEASDLTREAATRRPLSPCLVHPEAIEAACPPELRPLLTRILAIRAAHAAFWLTYEGRWRDSLTLLRRFCPPPTWRLPGVARAWLLANPAGALGGEGWRLARRTQRRLLRTERRAA